MTCKLSQYLSFGSCKATCNIHNSLYKGRLLWILQYMHLYLRMTPTCIRTIVQLLKVCLNLSSKRPGKASIHVKQTFTGGTYSGVHCTCTDYLNFIFRFSLACPCTSPFLWYPRTSTTFPCGRTSSVGSSSAVQSSPSPPTCSTASPHPERDSPWRYIPVTSLM